LAEETDFEIGLLQLSHLSDLDLGLGHMAYHRASRMHRPLLTQQILIYFQLQKKSVHRRMDRHWDKLY